MVRFARQFLVTVIFMLATSIPVLASTQDGISGNYRLILDRLPVGEIHAGEQISFSLALQSLQGKDVQRLHGWLRLRQGDRTILDTTDLSSDDGTINIDHRFQEPGEYEFLVRLIDQDTADEATATFPVVVKTGEGDGQTPLTSRQHNLALITLILGLVGGVMFAKSWTLATK